MAKTKTSFKPGDARPAGAGMPKGHVTAPRRARAEAIQRHVELDAAAVIEQIARGALYDLGDLFDEHGDIKPLHTLTEAQRACIAGMEFVMKNAAAGDGAIDRVLKIKLVDRAKFVDMAGRYHALFRDKLDVTVTEVGAKLDAARLAAAARNKGKAK